VCESDTSVLIEVLGARNRRRQQLGGLIRAGHAPATSVVNVAELFAGMRLGEEGAAAFLGQLDRFDLTSADARLAGRLKSHWSRKGRTLALPDAIVAAIAIENQCSLLTDNRKDFPMSELSLYTPGV
jgi:predicted nucleic acid-binding protein